MFVEEMMVDIPFVDCSIPHTPFRFPLKGNQDTVITSVRQPVQDLTETSISVFWIIDVLGENYSKLVSFENLRHGWDGYDAEVIPTSVINRTMSLLLDLSFKPKVFPTGRGSIQVEYYKNDDTFVEIEVFDNQIGAYCEGLRDTIEKDDITKKEACELLEEVYGK